jgi:hypothetical protein
MDFTFTQRKMQTIPYRELSSSQLIGNSLRITEAEKSAILIRLSRDSWEISGAPGIVIAIATLIKVRGDTLYVVTSDRDLLRMIQFLDRPHLKVHTPPVLTSGLSCETPDDLAREGVLIPREDVIIRFTNRVVAKQIQEMPLEPGMMIRGGYLEVNADRYKFPMMMIPGVFHLATDEMYRIIQDIRRLLYETYVIQQARRGNLEFIEYVNQEPPYPFSILNETELNIRLANDSFIALQAFSNQSELKWSGTNIIRVFS